MVIYSKSELESKNFIHFLEFFQERISQIWDNFKQVEKQLMKVKICDYITQTSEEAKFLSDSSSFFAEKEGELIPIDNSFINPQQWVEPVLKIHQSLKENASELEVNIQYLEGNANICWFYHNSL